MTFETTWYFRKRWLERLPLRKWFPVWRLVRGVSTEGNSSEGWHQPLEVRDVEMWRVSGGAPFYGWFSRVFLGNEKTRQVFLGDYFIISQYNKDPQKRNVEILPTWPKGPRANLSWWGRPGEVEEDTTRAEWCVGKAKVVFCSMVGGKKTWVSSWFGCFSLVDLVV